MSLRTISCSAAFCCGFLATERKCVNILPAQAVLQSLSCATETETQALGLYTMAKTLQEIGCRGRRDSTGKSADASVVDTLRDWHSANSAENVGVVGASLGPTIARSGGCRAVNDASIRVRRPMQTQDILANLGQSPLLPLAVLSVHSAAELRRTTAVVGMIGR